MIHLSDSGAGMVKAVFIDYVEITVDNVPLNIEGEICTDMKHIYIRIR